MISVTIAIEDSLFDRKIEMATAGLIPILFSTSFKRSVKRKCMDIDILLVFYHCSFDTFLLSRINESKEYGSDEYTHFKYNHIK